MTNFGKKMVKPALLLTISAALAFTFSAPAQADGAGAFLGGVAVARIGQSVRERNEYEEQQAYYARQQAAAAQSQAAQGNSAEAKLSQLDNMLRKGYITQAEYDAKKKEILDEM